MKPFGIILMGYLSWIIFSDKALKDKYAMLIGLLVSLQLFVTVGYMFVFGEFELLYGEFVLIIIILFSILIMFIKKIDKRLLLSGFILFSSIVLTEVLLTVIPLSEMILRNKDYVFPKISFYSLIVSLRMVAFIIVALVLKKELNKDNLNKIIDYIYIFGVFTYFIIFIEWVTKNILKVRIFNDAVTLIFGQGKFTLDTILTRGNLNSLQGLMREPAHFTEGIFYFTLLIILSDIKVKRINWVVLFSLTILLFSGSFSSVLYIATLIIVYIAKKKIKISHVMLIGAILLFLIPIVMSSDIFKYYYLRLINSVDFLKTNDASLLLTSEGYRIHSIIETFKLTFKRPLFGIGLGIPYSYGFLSMLFSSMGFLGVSAWYSFVFKIFAEMKIKPISLFILLSLTAVWIFTGSMGNAYSIVILLIAFEIGKISKQHPSFKQQDDIWLR